MRLQPSREEVVTSKEFLRNSVGLEYKTAGATLDATVFPEGWVEAGTAVFLNEETGLYEPWVAPDETGAGGTPATAVGAGLTAHRVEIRDGVNPIVGVLIAGHPLREKCVGVTDSFVEATAGYLRFDV